MLFSVVIVNSSRFLLNYSIFLIVGVDDVVTQLMSQTVLYSDNCYSIPNMNVRGHLCKTNLQARAAMRGAGKPQAVLFCETILREVANYLKVPALQVSDEII